jgi:hypothetical protein
MRCRRRRRRRIAAQGLGIVQSRILEPSSGPIFSLDPISRPVGPPLFPPEAGRSRWPDQLWRKPITSCGLHRCFIRLGLITGLARYRCFESISLQRRVRKLSVPA